MTPKTQILDSNMFKSGHVLYADELNTLVGRINSIIDDVASINNGDNESSSDDVDMEEIQRKIDEAVSNLTSLINQTKNRLDLRISVIEDADIGNTYHKTDEEWQELFKDIFKGEDGKELMNAVLFEMGICNEDGEPYFDTTVMQKINNTVERVSTLEQLPGQISLLVEHRENGQDVVKPASIIAAITDNNGVLNSSIGLSADSIVLDGQTFATAIDTKILNAVNANFGSLTSGNGTFRGNVEATSFKVMDGNDPSIVFTTMSDTYRGTGYENLDASGIANGEPIGLVYSGGTPKYFFDFAPVKAENFSAIDQLFYRISGASQNGKVNIQIGDVYFYVTSSGENQHKYIKTPNTNGTLVTTQSSLYERGQNSYAALTNRASGGHTLVSNLILYKEVTFTNGVKSYTGNAFLIASPLTGNNLTSYTPYGSTDTVYRDQIYNSDGTQLSLPLNASQYNNIYCIRQATNNTSSNNFNIGIIESISNITNITNRDLMTYQS